MVLAHTRQLRRERALAWLADFTARILPGILRRIGSWKGIPVARLRELEADVIQELTLDCLEHAETVARAPTMARHMRWIRLTERWIYHQHVRPHRRGTSADPDSLAAPNEPLGDQVGESSPLAIVHLKNGRCNLRGSARRSGSTMHSLKSALDRLAVRLDATGTPLQFWQRRLGEALVGLGSDLLRERCSLNLLPARRRPPDPEVRLRRIRRLAARFPLYLTPLATRKILACWSRRSNRRRPSAREALEQATRLCPESPDGWLWRFEAEIVDGDVAAAARTLRACRHRARPNAGRIVLARARLLEARGRRSAAVALLRRALCRWPTATRLRLAHRAGVSAAMPMRGISG